MKHRTGWRDETPCSLPTDEKYHQLCPALEVLEDAIKVGDELFNAMRGKFQEHWKDTDRVRHQAHRDQGLDTSSVPKTSQEKPLEKESQNKENDLPPKEIKNLPSTVVREQKVSFINTFLVIFFLVLIIFLFWTLRSYGTNIFVLVSFYINEFFFNLKLIIDDLAKIIYQIVN